MDQQGAPIPKNIELHQRSKTLELIYSNNRYLLSCEFLRVHSPSAEVKGHGPGEEILQTGKINVSIKSIKPVGSYAIQLVFDDGHDTGIYGWDYLHHLCVNEKQLWQDYLNKMQAAGANRDPDVQVVKIGL